MAASTAEGEMLKEAFRRWDVNKRGSIRRDELLTLMEQLSGGISRGEVNALVDELGQSPDVDYEEFVDYIFGPKSPSAPRQAARVLPRPASAVGTFLRCITVNDVYQLGKYPRIAACVAAARAAAPVLDCVVTSHLNGDFLSPCMITALDGGKTMAEALNAAKIDYVCLGNHEFDLGKEGLRKRMALFKGKTINSNGCDSEISHFPRYHSFKVGERTALVGGFVTGDESIYSPANLPTVTPITQACLDLWDKAKAELGLTPDVFLPMTHQTVAEDRETAVALGQHPELAMRTPVLFAGHEHEVFIESAGKSLVVKVGQDAEHVGIVDIWWVADGTMRTAHTMLPADDFPEDAECADFVRRKERFLKETLGVTIAQLPVACSSMWVRYEPSQLATWLLDAVKRGLKQDGVELVILNGGAVRGKAVYEPGPFTLGNLYSEFGFPTEQAIVRLPGDVIAESLRSSRAGDGEKPGFLHMDSGCKIDAEHRLVNINGKPLEPQKLYTVAIAFNLLKGMNNIGPLVAHVEAKKVKLPDLESCLPVKEIVLKVLMKDAWRQLVGYAQWDANGDGDLTEKEITAAIDSVLKQLDTNQDGTVSEIELRGLIESKGMPSGLLQHLIRALDKSGDGRISREEFRDLAV